MSFLNRDVYLKPAEQEILRKTFDEKKVKSVTDFLSKAVEQVKDGKDWAESLLAAAPWMKDVAEAVGDALPFVGAAAKLISKWLEPKLWELGAMACTLAYQAAVRDALSAEKSFSVDQYREGKKIDAKVVRQIKDAAPAEAADLSTFSFEDATSHVFVRRADRALKITLDAIGLDDDRQAKVFNRVHDGFIEKLKDLLADAKTKDKFEPFKTAIVDLTTDEKRLRVALAAHAEYQREQYASDPVFRIEPFALKDIYVDTECGFLRWGEIHPPTNSRRQGEDKMPMPERIDPFLEQHGKRHDLIKTVMELILDEGFREEPIVVQGYAGAGKSSFTLRLCDELLNQGFCPIRVRLKKLTLGHSLFDVLPSALELDDQDHQLRVPSNLRFSDHLLSQRYGQTDICRYVLIMDGWDELSLSENRGFKESVQEMLRQIRSEVLARDKRMRVIVTGRPSEDVAAASSFLRADTPVLTVRPIRPDQLRDLVKALQRALNERPIAVANETTWTIPDLARFEQVFEQYEQDFAANQPEAEPEIEEDFQLVAPEADEPIEIQVDEFEEGTEVEGGEAFVDVEPAPRRVRLRRNSESGLDVLGSPLLAHLAVRVMARTSGDLMELVNQPTRLYRQLTDLTCEKAGKFAGDRRDTETQRRQWHRLQSDQLRWLLQRTAAAMTVGGREYISKEQLERRLFDDDDGQLNKLTDRIKHDNPLSALMISFFFKGGHPQLGCEFAHKSFREYLTAECIVETLKEFGNSVETRPLPPRVPVEQESEARKEDDSAAIALLKARDFAEDDPRWKFSRDLSRLIAPQWLKPEVLNHLRELLRWEIERAGQSLDDADLFAKPMEPVSFKAWETVRDGLAELWSWWTDGVHLRSQWVGKRKKREIVPPYVYELIKWTAPIDENENYDESIAFETAATMDAHLGDGLFRLCAWVHLLIAEAENWLEPREDGKEVTPDPLWEGVSARKIYDWYGESEVLGEGESPHPFQSAIVQGTRRWLLFAPSGADLDLFQRCIARVNSTEGRPAGSFPSMVEGQGIDLRGASLDGASLYGARLVGARLVGASLDGASLDGARLDGASLDRARLDGARLDGASLDGASLVGASLDGASLDGASLDRARLVGARLVGASLDRARLVGASLDGASLDRARLVGARLVGASLVGASLDRARLVGANLSDARNLKWEQIESAYIDEETKLPDEFEQLKQEKLNRQRQEEEAIELDDEDGKDADDTDESLN